MTTKEALFEYILRIADNNLILGQRLSECCGHAPELEIDIALTNIALDLIGQSRNLFLYAAELEGKGRTEDDLAFLRDCPDFRNVLLVEQPNEDFAYIIVRQFFFDVYNYLFHKELTKSNDTQLKAIADKSVKEIAYHLRFSSEWVIRLGDGTETSRKKMQVAVDDLWDFAGELLAMDEIDRMLVATGIAVDMDSIRPLFLAKIEEVLEEATLTHPDSDWYQSGGRQGRHSEYLGHILAEMQWMQRAYPNATW